MPGVLPLKTIQLNSSSQSRIAQACDRCRSKKIRCDGVQPNCTPCQAVNFECKTSDKLSRKAYPKGYTSSLEERVRDLEAEIRQLKDLLDEKDEKIDILSKMRRPSGPHGASLTPPASTPSDHGKDDSIKVRPPVRLYAKEKGSAYFMGSSSSRCFVDAFKAKLQQSGKLPIPFDSAALFVPAPLPVVQAQKQPTSPPRMVADQLINVYFQEWAPLFPIVHRPTFLRVYEGFVTCPVLKDPRQHAQMYLIFGIAALSSMTNVELVPMFEVQWRKALDAAILDSSVETLQCLLLAQLYCIVKGDHRRLVHYTGVAVSMSNRLGLHQSQKRFNLGALSCETRKKVFWSLYTLDCFAAVSLGLPRLLRDSDVETENPADVDDENVSEQGFQATLPGEHTKISSALALFRAARLLSKVIEEVYPAAGAQDLSLSKIANLSDELDAWRDSLPAHLRLEFIQDKLNVNITSSRSPLLSLVYFHIRSCIHRPVVAANLGDRALTSVIALADSSKRIYQIMKVLQMRQMSVTLPINRIEILSLAGVGLLFQTLELKSESKLTRENQRLTASIAELLGPVSKSASTTLMKMSCTLLGQEASPTPKGRASPEGSMSPPKLPEAKSMSPRDQLQAIAARFSFSASRSQKRASQSQRQAATSHPPSVTSSSFSRSGSQGSRASQGSERSVPLESVALAPYDTPETIALGGPPGHGPNLDFFSLGSQPQTPDLTSPLKLPGSCGEWDQLLEPYPSYDVHTPTEAYGGGGGGPDYLAAGVFPPQVSPPAPAGLNGLDWSPLAWNLLDASATSTEPPASASAHSVLSLSDESLTSAEDLSSCDLGSDYPGFAIPVSEEFADFPEFGLHGDFTDARLATAS